jgi:RNA polymerase sigma-70 factor (ECF subfamily)
LNDIFHTTRWTLVRHATASTPEGRAILSELCAAYYEPVVAFLRSSGRDADSAREAAHGFFAAILEKPALGSAEPGRGRFRSYLLGALKHHLANVREHDSRKKRGGGAEHVAIEPGTDTSPGVDVPDTALPPDGEFDRQWALHTLHRAMAALEAEWTRDGKAEEFVRLRPFIAGETGHGALAALAASRNEDAATLRKTGSRLRQRFRHHMKLIIGSTLDDPAAVDTEMRALLLALG